MMMTMLMLLPCWSSKTHGVQSVGLSSERMASTLRLSSAPHGRCLAEKLTPCTLPCVLLECKPSLCQGRFACVNDGLLVLRSGVLSVLI